MANKRSLADEWYDRPASPAPEPPAMGEEQLRSLEKQIEAAKERGNRGEKTGERVRELRQAHYKGNGSPGG